MPTPFFEDLPIVEPRRMRWTREGAAVIRVKALLYAQAGISEYWIADHALLVSTVFPE